MSSRQYDTSCTEDSSVQYIGDQFQWVDMYSTTGGALVFTNGEYDLVGTVTGQSFEVTGTFGQMLGSSYYEWELDIEGDLSGKDLTGDSNLKEISGDADGECRSQTQVSFEGVKMKSWDQPNRTIGTQSSQTATANE
tara:strand:- start:157 stop:567 length:411 start_codon:yes stop_codon:yes gene_type:complete